ncbi:uncharacterized protein CEXT_671031 [Caerostris extrusa]|uniref:Uncharacterized protein n=1 Tax=Caerostris extrusa TaxID=172846 RepID=A0AAV4RV46_CAEEX|nr:uncharacterized protein CEXT_671031 [Caerostris extrusa]
MSQKLQEKPPSRLCFETSDSRYQISIFLKNARKMVFEKAPNLESLLLPQEGNMFHHYSKNWSQKEKYRLRQGSLTFKERDPITDRGGSRLNEGQERGRCCRRCLLSAPCIFERDLTSAFRILGDHGDSDSGYDMCQFQTVVNMRAGLWSQCQENPFTRVPPKIVDKFREFIFSLNFRQLPNHEALHLLFTSHRLKKLDLSCFYVKEGETFSADDPYSPPHLKEDIDIHVPMNELTGDEYSYYCGIIPGGTDICLRTKKHMEDECNSLLYMLSKDPQPDLQSYVMTKTITISKFALQPLIQVSTNLTEIHTYIHWVKLNVVMNCKMLRILRLHTSPSAWFFDCPKQVLETCEKVLPSLENLEIFTICNREIDCFGMHQLAAIALAHCPKLTSVGHFNSAMAIDFLKSKTNKSHTGCFRLKKCFWGFGARCESPFRLNKVLNLKSSFPELIKTAVSCCPFVEELILQVVNKDCLQHLRRLKRLNSLVLECSYCEDFEIDECLSSLGEITHQLKHFVIKGINRFTIGSSLPLNVVSDNCGNLETLGVLDNSAIIFPLKIYASFRFLKRIFFITSLDYLGQILRYCDNLTYLVMIGHFTVDESELRKNLSHTSALKLQTLGINSPYFSKCHENGV